MSESELAYRFSQSEFVRAWEAGAFDHRVELIDGEIWPVVIGDWHGRTVGRLIRLLPPSGGETTTATLPTGESLPDPDCWVLRADAEPCGTIGSKLSVWAAADVLLVVEVSDETVIQDLNTRAKLYGQAGYPAYWVVTQDAKYEHTVPGPTGYQARYEYLRGSRIPVGYAGTDLAVDEVLG